MRVKDSRINAAGRTTYDVTANGDEWGILYDLACTARRQVPRMLETESLKGRLNNIIKELSVPAKDRRKRLLTDTNIRL